MYVCHPDMVVHTFNPNTEKQAGSFLNLSSRSAKALQLDLSKQTIYMCAYTHRITSFPLLFPPAPPMCSLYSFVVVVETLCSEAWGEVVEVHAVCCPAQGRPERWPRCSTVPWKILCTNAFYNLPRLDITN